MTILILAFNMNTTFWAKQHGYSGVTTVNQ